MLAALYAGAVPLLIGAAIFALLMGIVGRWLERRAQREPPAKSRPPVATGLATPSSDLTLEEGPPCPACQGEMVIRVARRGPQAGKRFWGCSNYPSCRRTRALA